MARINKIEIRMYRMGTGDCFVLKFFSDDSLSFKMMIDCGTWQGTKEFLNPYIENLKEYVGNHIDLLVITHEHKDHVHLFDVCKDLFKENFIVDKTWMAWTENDSAKSVKQWQKNYGNKKKALAYAAEKLQAAINDPDYVNQIQQEYNGFDMQQMRQTYADTVSNFSDLQLDKMKDDKGKYVGGLAGMKFVKDELSSGKIEYYSPGDIIENLPKLEGIKFYVLGPPLSWEEVKVETGGQGESYDHNKELAEGEAFTSAILTMAGESTVDVLPFDKSYEENILLPQQIPYYQQVNEWRRIDTDWLNSAGLLALRINSITNNLSLALAIEFEESGRIMLFPGDAEYGSWASWHTIKWNVPSRKKDVHLTEDLLNRTVFYKVAHHMSHHGTAERLGMEMMKDPDLTAMATLDYNVISSTWKNTMPNRALLKALVTQTKGRLMVMKLDQLFYDVGDSVKLEDKIKNERKKMTAKEVKDFDEAYVENNLYLQFTVTG